MFISAWLLSAVTSPARSQTVSRSSSHSPAPAPSILQYRGTDSPGEGPLSATLWSAAAASRAAVVTAGETGEAGEMVEQSREWLGWHSPARPL